MSDPNLLSTTEAAAEVGVTGRTIRQWISDGLLNASTAVRGAYRVKKTDVLRVAESRASASRQADAPNEAPIRRLYTSGVSVLDICTQHGISKAQFDAMRRAGKWTRASDPFTDNEIATRSLDDLTADQIEAKRQVLSRKVAAANQRATDKAAAQWWDFENQAKMLVDGLAEKRFKFGAPKPPGNWSTGPILAVVFPTDLHYGKYGTDALGPGRGDRDSTLARLFDHTYNLVSQAQALGAEELLVYVGSDGVNADTALGTTTKGTPQSNDGEMAEIAQEGLQMWFDLIELLRSFGVLVRVKTRPGNHDDLLTRVYGKALEIAYRDCDDVLVDSKALEYGFFEWGKCMVMDTHGHGRSSTKDLAEVMATHRPDMWGRCPHRYAFRGNLHHTKDEEGCGIRNILLPSLSCGDAYHQLKWPALHRPTMRMPILSADRGMLAILESGPDWNFETNDWEVV